MTPAQEQAARITGALWQAIRSSGGIRIKQYRHYPAVFGPLWLESLSLPIGDDKPAVQPVALIDNRHSAFERHRDAAMLREEYQRRPRTKVYEDIGHESDAWYALTAGYLTRLSRSGLHVTCSVFENKHGDETFGAHQDTWFGAVIMFAGAKEWTLGEGLPGETEPAPRKVTTYTGDVLLIPKNLPHSVRTPEDPGFSVHLAFAIDRDQL
ncbi:MAG: hypothetical protein JOY82_01150 [Streptosporangiaceae bacterium]|nr:hypothetical protein [Streptosporangiaceae bacterium]